MHRLISLIPVVLDTEPVLACPISGGVEVHPTSVRCNPAGELSGQVRIEEPGVLWNANVEPDGRGFRVDLLFWCERRHAFGVSFYFEKSRTLVNCLLDPTDTPTRIIWRT